MAPREAKESPKVQRGVLKPNSTKRPTAGSTASVGKKTSSTIKTRQQTPIKTPTKAKTNMGPNQQRINALATPKPKENKPVTCPGSVSKSAKKSWKRRPKPAHSGVPVPEKMKRCKQLLDGDLSF